MVAIRDASFLRRVLLVDAAASAAVGAGMLGFSDLLARALQLPAALLVEAGWLLLPFAAFVGFLALRAQPPRAGVWTVIAINIVWVVNSIVLLFTGWVAPSVLGYAFVIGQAAFVLALAGLEYLGLERCQGHAAGHP